MAQRAWFITGVNSGFGREMTEQLLGRGDRVAGTVRNLDSVRDLTEKYGDRFWSARLDVTDTAEIRRVVDAAFNALGTIDVVVNNAGYGLFGAAEEFTDEQVVHEIGTNLLGSIQVVRSALPHLRAQQQARIIQISTFGGQAALPGGSMYHASKWGIEGFSEALMAELAPFNIGVTIIEPGGARTSFRHGSAQLAPALDAYAGTPAAFVRGILADETHLSPGTRPRWRRSLSAAWTRIRHLSGSCWAATPTESWSTPSPSAWPTSNRRRTVRLRPTSPPRRTDRGSRPRSFG
jgi:NAD(P)-dependent dehydrogenase (short-subunit alcohol dehydrogenase family)